MHIRCRECSALVRSEDIELVSRIAKCQKCHAVFSIAGQLTAEGLGEPERAAPPKPLPAQPPAQLSIEEWSTDLTIWYRWFEWSALGMLFFCIFWDGFLVVWYSIAFFAPMNGGDPRWLMIVFPVLHVAVGVAITYATACSLLNATWINVSGGVFSIRHGPIPTWGNYTLDAKEIDQLFVGYGSGWRQKGATQGTLAALLANGTRLDLLTSGEPELLYWLEWKLEEKLKIMDRPVPGEMEW